LPLYLPVLEPGDDVFDAGPDPAVRPVAVVAARGGDRGGDRRDAAASAVADDDTTIKQLGHGVAGHDDVVAVTWPALAGYHDSAPVGADDDLGVDAAAAVLAGGGDRLVVRRDQGAVDDARVVAVVGCEHLGQRRDQVADDALRRRLAGAERCWRRPGGQVGCTGSHHPVASAEQAALGPPPNSPGTPGRRGTSRKQPAPKLIGAA